MKLKSSEICAELKRCGVVEGTIALIDGETLWLHTFREHCIQFENTEGAYIYRELDDAEKPAPEMLLIPMQVVDWDILKNGDVVSKSYKLVIPSYMQQKPVNSIAAQLRELADKLEGGEG